MRPLVRSRAPSVRSANRQACPAGLRPKLRLLRDAALITPDNMSASREREPDFGRNQLSRDVSGPTLYNLRGKPGRKGTRRRMRSTEIPH
jgi:hypothetical protein